MSIGGVACLYEFCVKSCNAHDLKMEWYMDVGICGEFFENRGLHAYLVCACYEHHARV
jgi:hypothetical protein